MEIKGNLSEHMNKRYNLGVLIISIWNWECISEMVQEWNPKLERKGLYFVFNVGWIECDPYVEGSTVPIKMYLLNPWRLYKTLLNLSLIIELHDEIRYVLTADDCIIVYYALLWRADCVIDLQSYHQKFL